MCGKETTENEIIKDAEKTACESAACSASFACGPLVSVCMLTYNHEKYIRQTLDSVLMQETDFPIEILVHDDASPDGTADILREYWAKYPDILKPIFQKENQWRKLGWGVLKEFVYPKARGKYVAMCEGDDYWTDPKKLARQVAYLEARPACSATFHAVNWVCDGEIVKADQRFPGERDVGVDEVIGEGGDFIATSSLVYRAEYAMDFPHWRDRVFVGDYPLQALLALRGPVHYFPEFMGAYRTGHAESWTTQMDTKKHQQERLDFLRLEADWLREFDAATGGKWAATVEYKAGCALAALYLGGRVPLSAGLEAASKLPWGKKRLKLYKKLYERMFLKLFRGGAER